MNPYNLPILNLWRANMDITGIIGDAFGAVVYIAYYTSKVDKKVDIKSVLAALSTMNDGATTSSRLRKAFLKIDSSKAIGTCEAVSNILGYPTGEPHSK